MDQVVEQLPATKICNECDRELPLTAFYKRSGGRYPNHPRAKCKDCQSSITKLKRIEDLDFRLQLRKSRIKNRHGITLDQYNDLLIQRNGLCAICEQPPTEGNTKYGLLAIDHNHITKQVRGLLCDPCNQGIGFLKDDIELLNRAIQYLERISNGTDN